MNHTTKLHKAQRYGLLVPHNHAYVWSTKARTTDCGRKVVQACSMHEACCTPQRVCTCQTLVSDSGLGSSQDSFGRQRWTHGNGDGCQGQHQIYVKQYQNPSRYILLSARPGTSPSVVLHKSLDVCACDWHRVLKLYWSCCHPTMCACRIKEEVMSSALTRVSCQPSSLVDGEQNGLQ